MAANQATTSAVAIDAASQPQSKPLEGYPLYWSNKPSADDAIAVKYTSKWSTDCVASNSASNLCLVASKGGTILYNQSSGAVLHSISGERTAVYLSPDCKKFWSGTKGGEISVRDVESGAEEWSVSISDEASVIWMRDVGGLVACGTGLESTICWDDHTAKGKISMVDPEKKDISVSWSTKEPTFCYCFHQQEQMIFSGHKGSIKGWSLSGDLKKTFSDAGPCVFSLGPHPTKNLLVSGSQDFKIRQWNIESEEAEIIVEDPGGSAWTFGGNWAILYDSSGNRILTTNPNCQAIRIYRLDGSLQAELKGHSESINRIFMLPGGNQVVTVARDGSRLFNLPKADDVIEDEGIIEYVVRCAFLVGHDSFVTVSKDALRVWDTETCQVIRSCVLAIEESWLIASVLVHCNGKYVGVVGDRTKVAWYDVDTLEELVKYNALYESENDGRITHAQISPDGQRTLLVECRNSNSEKSLAYVYDNNVITERSEPVRHRGYGGRMFSCDVHPDNVRAVIGGHRGMVIFDMLTGEQLHKVNDVGCFCVRFTPSGEQVLYEEDSDFNICVYDGTVQKTYVGHADKVTEARFVGPNNSRIISSGEDGSIRLFDVESQQCLYAFVNHRAQDFKCLIIHPSGNLVIAGNENELLYILKTKDN